MKKGKNPEWVKANANMKSNIKFLLPRKIGSTFERNRRKRNIVNVGEGVFCCLRSTQSRLSLRKMQRLGAESDPKQAAEAGESPLLWVTVVLRGGNLGLKKKCRGLQGDESLS